MTTTQAIWTAPPGSPCRALPALWDGEDYLDIAAAIEGCHERPSLADCHTWAHGRADLQGVVAGIPRGDSIGKWDRGITRRAYPTVRS